ncbi:MAG: polysaccharide deacetylase family protein, partial [Planctomycetota bacterium]|nr:polysaccharide deacetylase family protein [Planctomycetota bacterium]
MRSVLAAAFLLALLLFSLSGCATGPREDQLEREVRVPILMYHHVRELDRNTDPITLRFTVAPDQFAAQCQYLRDAGYTAIDTRQLVDALTAGTPLPDKPVLITFDDGWAHQYTDALPIMERFGLRATFFVYTNGANAGRAGGYMSYDDLRDILRRGGDVQSHTVSHPMLSRLALMDLDRELSASKRELELKLGRPVEYLAYPFGDVDERVIEATRAAGYRA